MHRCCLGFLAAAMAGAGIPDNPNAKLPKDGHSMHSVGTARMGDDPKSSVTKHRNPNPALLIMALTLRSSELPADVAEERGL